MSSLKPNRLIFERSPYLLQHANNPVNWYPWVPEAFEKAMREDKPVFLSIGYSTCHWCHVMEKESFEDIEVAELLNDTFVCIKVDREERPDLNSVYMKVCQQLTGSGGWPLHIIMTPQKKPFFAATYVPKEGRFGYVGMKQLIPKIRELWKYRRDELLDSATKIVETLLKSEALSVSAPGEDIGASTLDEAYSQLLESYDEENGGFGVSPKFPSPHKLTFLLRYWKRTENPKALEMARRTLWAMRMGGLYDHLGFGFHRYSTDAQWLVPHFEKMLYDQALLIMAYAEAYQATGEKMFEQTARETITYVLREMTDPLGGFYSAEDADIEGEEGRFYLWTQEEFAETLIASEAEFAESIFSVERDGNFFDVLTREKTGRNTLHLRKRPDEFALDGHTAGRTIQERLEEARRRLFEKRQKRVHPGKDDKILVDWNGLMIMALSKAAQIFGSIEYANAARKAADFVLEKMLKAQKNRLHHRYRDGEVKVLGLLDDYAYLAWGLLELYETTFEDKYVERAIELTNTLIESFWDERQGGFYVTAVGEDVPLIRTKEVYDGALPSGNSVACLVLMRLAHITGEYQYEEKAARLIRSFSSAVSKSPSAFTQLLSAVDFALGPTCEVVVVDGLDEEGTKCMLNALRSRFSPRKVVMHHSSLSLLQGKLYLDRLTQGLTSQEGKATAYVCCNRICSLPTTDPNKMLELIDKKPQ